MTAALLGDADSGEMPPAVAAVAAVAVAVDRLLAVDLTVPGDADLLDLLRGVEVQARRLHAVSVRVVGQVTVRGVAVPAGASSTVGLVRQVLPLSGVDAAQRVRLAAATNPSMGLTGEPVPARLPLLAAALQAGWVGAAQAAVTVSTLTNFPAGVPAEVRESVEEFLVEQAGVLDPRTFHGVARRIALMADPEGPDPERDAAEKQEFHIGRRREDGLTRCWGLFDDVTVEALRAAFGALCAPAADRNRRKTGAPGTGAPGAGTSTDVPGSSDTDAGTSGSEVPAGDIPDGAVDPVPAPDPGGTSGEASSDSVVPAAGPADVSTTLPEDTAAAAPDSGPTTGEASRDIDVDEPPAPADPPAPPAPADQPGPADQQTPAYPADQPAPAGRSAPREPWRPTRPPFGWAPLGTVPGDYPPRPPEQPPDPDSPDSPSSPDSADSAAFPPPPEDRRSAATRRAHAVATIVSVFLATGAAPMIHGEKPHLLITVAEADLRRGVGSAQLGYGDTIPIGAARMLACDAVIIPAVLRGVSDVIDIGRGMRTFTAAGRKAMLLRDIGCTFPGCPMPGAWCDQHHIQHWADGGPSNLDNAALLCRRHHNLIHRGQWQVRLGPDRTPEFIPPTTHDRAQQPLRNTVHRPPTYQWPTRGQAATT